MRVLDSNVALRNGEIHSGGGDGSTPVISRNSQVFIAGMEIWDVLGHLSIEGGYISIRNSVIRSGLYVSNGRAVIEDSHFSSIKWCVSINGDSLRLTRNTLECEGNHGRVVAGQRFDHGAQHVE